MGRRIIIHISKGMIFLNPSISISVSDTNLAEGEVSIKERANAFWEVEITNETTVGNTITLKVTNYRSRNIQYFNNQQIQSNWLKIHFRSLDWNEFEPLLSSYRQTL